MPWMKGGQAMQQPHLLPPTAEPPTLPGSHCSDLLLPFACRIANVCIGVCMDVTVTSLLFPVTTGALMEQQLLQALLGLAGLAQGVAASQAGSALAGVEQLESGGRALADQGVAERQQKRLEAQAAKVRCGAATWR